MKKETTCTYYIAGMHCASCEVLIQKKLSKLDGVLSANASLINKKVEITYAKGKKKNLDHLNEELYEHGYTLSEEPVGKVALNQLTVMKAMVAVIFFAIAYLILEDTKLLARFTVNEDSGVPAFFILGIVAGLSSCAALVGGLLLSLSKQWNELYGGANAYKNYIPFSLFNIGRLVSFALGGALLGYIGSLFQISIQFNSMLVLVVSLFMVLLGLQMLGVPWFRNIRFGLPSFLTKNIADEENFKGQYMPFMMGVLTFFLPCGFTLLAQTIALTTGSPITSMLMMTAFALGTLPMLGVISFSSIKLQKNNSFAGSFNLITAIFIVLFGLYNINSQMNVLGLVSASDLIGRQSTETTNDQTLGVRMTKREGTDIQEVTMQASGFEYFPATLNLKADIPTELTVQNIDVIGCARAMFATGLFEDVLYLQGAESKTSFVPKKGSYKISCTMGMVRPVIVNVNQL